MFDSRLFSAIRAEVFIWKSVTLQLSKLWFSVSCLYSGRLSNYLSGFCKNAPANRTFSPLNVKLNIRARKTVVIFHFSKSSTSLRIVQTVVTSSSFQRPSTAHEETGGQRCSPVMQGHRGQDNHPFFYFLPLPFHAPPESVALLPRLPSIILSSSLTAIIILLASLSSAVPDRRPPLPLSHADLLPSFALLFLCFPLAPWNFSQPARTALSKLQRRPLLHIGAF